MSGIGEEMRVDEKVLEEIRFHQDVVNKDANSPLYQIREKEMEIHGRVLAAKIQAENIVTEARQKAVELIATAERESDELAQQHADALLAKAAEGAAAVGVEVEDGIGGLKSRLATCHQEAVDFVVSAVTSA